MANEESLLSVHKDLLDIQRRMVEMHGRLQGASPETCVTIGTISGTIWAARALLCMDIDKIKAKAEDDDPFLAG